MAAKKSGASGAPETVEERDQLLRHAEKVNSLGLKVDWPRVAEMLGVPLMPPEPPPAPPGQ